MPFSPQALIKGLVSRTQPAAQADGAESERSVRLGRYGEVRTEPMVRKSHLLADEGAYFIATNGQTGLAMTATVALSLTAPFFIIQNMDSGGGKRIYLDYCALVTTAAGSAASGLTFIGLTVGIDAILRYSSGGTSLLGNIYNANMDVGNAKSVAAIYAGTPTALAGSAMARYLIGQRSLRPTVSGAVADVIGEQKLLNFGGVEGGSGSFTLANANLITCPLPPIIIGPGHSALLYVYYQTATTPVAASYAPELGWFER